MTTRTLGIETRVEVKSHPLVDHIHQVAEKRTVLLIDTDFITEFKNAPWDVQCDIAGYLQYAGSFSTPPSEGDHERIERLIHLQRAQTLFDLWMQEHGYIFVKDTWESLALAQLRQQRQEFLDGASQHHREENGGC